MGSHLFWLGDLFFERKTDCNNLLHKTCSSTKLVGQMRQNGPKSKKNQNKLKNGDKATRPGVSILISIEENDIMLGL